MDKAIFAEELPIFGITKVQTTSKFRGQALARCLGQLRYVVSHYPGRQAYVRYQGKITHASEAWMLVNPKRVISNGTIKVGA